MDRRPPLPRPRRPRPLPPPASPRHLRGGDHLDRHPRAQRLTRQEDHAAAVTHHASGLDLTEGRGFSTTKAKRELGWELRYPSWRQGFKEALACPGPTNSIGPCLTS